MLADAAGDEDDDAQDEWPEGSPDEPVEILPGNAGACRLFFALGTQWRAVGIAVGASAMIVRTSLDYGPLAAIAAALEIRVDASLLAQLQILEAEAAAAMAKAQAAR